MFPRIEFLFGPGSLPETAESGSQQRRIAGDCRRGAEVCSGKARNTRRDLPLSPCKIRGESLHAKPPSEMRELEGGETGGGNTLRRRDLVLAGLALPFLVLERQGARALAAANSAEGAPFDALSVRQLAREL